MRVVGNYDAGDADKIRVCGGGGDVGRIWGVNGLPQAAWRKSELQV